MTNLDSILKSRDITLPTKYGFSTALPWMWQLNYKEGWVPKNWCFWTVVLEKTFESPLDCRRSNQSILKEIIPGYSLEGLMLKAESPILWLPDANSWLIGKGLDDGKDRRQEEKMTEDEMVELHHQLSGHESEQTLGDGEGQGSLVCCSPWGPRFAHDLATEQ